MAAAKSKSILLLVDDIYEDLELWYPKLRLAEAGIRPIVAGPQAGKKYAGKHGYPCVSDAAISEMNASDFAGIICPGGFMPDKLRRDLRPTGDESATVVLTRVHGAPTALICQPAAQLPEAPGPTVGTPPSAAVSPPAVSGRPG